MKHKFNAKRTVINNRSYPSKLEANYAQRLHMAKKNGELLFWLEQVPFSLGDKIKYLLDFMEFWAPKEGQETGDIIFTECKGMMTPVASLKLRLFNEKFPMITLNIVKK